MRIPEIGDKFFTGFESEYTGMSERKVEILRIETVENTIIDEKEREGKDIIASDGYGYDCFWSEKYKIFVYGLD